ncbi:uncharacterized protein Z520_06215 [Fonsecaea multimorphosa CBS 102226]|uniref:Uncharacterized protein n=1 Tax=Fonsecaea multimorphosa CBS 102226 TaxID=1442371 RepID=A0A0D2H8E9_9EURO|nr:uncharacterized protein Z520_06215 [Fonsecaea multimorphosa CBS 102226]KIX98135.1 hypothetical protein Z520_06215 [Fonsecaea multimorphosa CBS 102226]
MLSFKWTLLFLLLLISNVTAIPGINNQDMQILVGAAGAVGVVSILGWHLAKHPKAAEDKLVAVFQSVQDGIQVMESSLSPTPTATSTTSEGPSVIVKTIISEGNTDGTPQSIDPLAEPKTRFFEVGAWSNGTITRIEEIISFQVHNTNDTNSNSSVTADNDTLAPHEWLDHENSQAERVSKGINLPVHRPSALNASSVPWNLASIFANAYADQKTKPIVEFARRKFFVVRDFLNKALGLFLKLAPAPQAFILVGIPLLANIGTVKKGLVILSRFAPLALLYLLDDLSRYIEGYPRGEAEPELTIEADTQPLPVDELVVALDTLADVPLGTTPATQSTSSLTETEEDDGAEAFDVTIESDQQSTQTAWIGNVADDEEESLPMVHPEHYTDTGICKRLCEGSLQAPPPRDSARVLEFIRNPRARKQKKEHPPPQSSRPGFRRPGQRLVLVRSALPSGALLSNTEPEAQVEATNLPLPQVPAEIPNQPQQDPLTTQAPECTAASLSERAPSSQSGMSVLPASEDMPILDNSHESEPADSQLLSIASNEHDLTDATFTEGQGTTTPSESVVSPACAPVLSTPIEDHKKDEDQEPQHHPPAPTVEVSEDESDIPNASGPLASVLETIVEEEEPKESTDQSQADGGSSNDEACENSLPSEEPPFSGDSTELSTAGFDELFNSDTPVSTPSKQPVVNRSKGTDECRPSILRSLTPSAEKTTTRPKPSRGVTIAADADGSVVNHTRHFLEHEAPAAVQESMVIDAQGQAATGVPLSAEQSTPMTTASSGEQPLLNPAAEDPTPGYQVQEQQLPLGTPGIDPAFLRTLHSWSNMSAEYQAQTLAESAQSTACPAVACEQAPSDLMEVVKAASESDPLQSGLEDMSIDAELSARMHLLSLEDAPVTMDFEQPVPMDFDRPMTTDFERPVAMDFEPGGPAVEFQFQFPQEAPQELPSPVLPPGYEPARPAGIFHEQSDLAAPGQYDQIEVDTEMEEDLMPPEHVEGLLAFNHGTTSETPAAASNEQQEPMAPEDIAALLAFNHGTTAETPAAVSNEQQEPMAPEDVAALLAVNQGTTAEAPAAVSNEQQEFMAPEDVAALLAFNEGTTSETPEAASNEVGDQPVTEPRPCKENLLQSPIPGLSIHKDADLEAERRDKPNAAKRARDGDDRVPTDPWADTPQADRMRQYEGCDRKYASMKSVTLRCDPLVAAALLQQESQQTRPAVNPFENLEHTTYPVIDPALLGEPVSQAREDSDAPQVGTQPQHGTGEMYQEYINVDQTADGDDDLHEESGVDNQVTPGDEEDNHGQGETGEYPPLEEEGAQEEVDSHYPELEDDTLGYVSVDHESEDAVQDHGDSSEDEFEAAQRAYERQRAIAEAYRTGESAYSANAEHNADEEDDEEEEESEEEDEESDEEGGEDPWDDSDSDDGYGGGYGQGDSEGNGDSGGSQERQGFGEEEDESEEELSEDDEDDDDDDDDDQSADMPGEEDGFPCRERMFRELNQLQATTPQPDTIEEPWRVVVNGRRTYDHASVASNIWWCATVGREWLWANWDGIRRVHGRYMIALCQEIIGDHEELDS